MTNKKSTTHFPMNLRWTLYTASKPPKGVQKHKMAVSRTKINFFWRKSATKFICVKTISSRVVRHSLAYLNMHKCFAGDIPLNVNFVHKDTQRCSGSECYRWRHQTVSVATGLLRITPDLLSIKTQKNADIRNDLIFRPKLTSNAVWFLYDSGATCSIIF